MAKPSINPKLFEGQKICSLKHDDYLILLKKDSDYLKKIVKHFFKLKIEKYQEIIIWKNENKTSSCAYKSYLQTEEGKIVKDYVEKKVPYIKIPLYDSIQIEHWSPERTIKNNGYYIGSIDLSVIARIDYKIGLLIDKERNWIWEHNTTSETKEFIFEFKPNINSYSEVIRQIKVYSSYLENDIIPICITESETSKFKEIFESQGIYIFNINEFETEKNEGVKDDGGF